jgi:SEC-C motif-containing protein
MKCPCGTGKEIENCCQPFIDGEEFPTTPEQLMRSRYTAFCQQNMDYIEETTDPQTRGDYDMKANADWAKNSKFLKLEVLNSSQEGNKGTVEFKAWYRTGDGPEELHHELSKFRKQAGVWYFRDAKSKSSVTEKKS